MDNKIELPHNQLILNTGEHHTGIIFVPFGNEVPSDYSAPRHAPISSGESGWIAKPDAGRSDLTKDASIGEPHILALLALIYISIKKCMLVVMLLLSFGHIHAQVSALTIETAVSGEVVTITPTIASVPYTNASICWGLYYDEACTNEVEDVVFRAAPSTGINAVGFRAPNSAGTYYIKSSLSAAHVCGGLVDSYLAEPLIVYPSGVDMVLKRDAQGRGTVVDITERVASIQAYGAMRFSKTALNDEGTSIYERYNYFISFPFDVQIGDIYGFGAVGADWRILYYDGKGRAENGFFADRTDNWVMFDDTEDVLRAGEGYLLQLNTFSMNEDNEDIWVNGADIATLFFPALSSISKIETDDVTIPALGSDYECTINLSATLGEDGDRTIKDSYWRCVGVPSFSSPSNVDGLEYFYEWNTADNSLNVRSSIGFAFEPTHAYLVQNGESFTWLNATLPASVVARKRDTEAQERKIEILQGDVSQDQTFIRLTDEAGVTEGFDFGWDLSKERNAGKANIYTMVGYERLAANVLPDTVRTIPVGIRIEDSGDYRLVTNEDAWLVDNLTGVRTQDYTVYLNTGSYEGRFSLEIGEAVSTSIHNSELLPQPSRARKVLFNGILYIEKDGKRYIIH